LCLKLRNVESPKDVKLASPPSPEVGFKLKKKNDQEKKLEAHSLLIPSPPQKEYFVGGKYLLKTS
jgi:hypothetical protein